MNRMKIAITIRSLTLDDTALNTYSEKFDIIYRNKTGERLSEDQLILALKDAEGVIAGTEEFSEKVISSTKNLRAISRVGVGIDSIDIASAQQRNIQIFTTPRHRSRLLLNTPSLCCSALSNVSPFTTNR